MSVHDKIYDSRFDDPRKNKRIFLQIRITFFTRRCRFTLLRKTCISPFSNQTVWSECFTNKLTLTCKSHQSPTFPRRIFFCKVSTLTNISFYLYQISDFSLFIMKANIVIQHFGKRKYIRRHITTITSISNKITISMNVNFANFLFGFLIPCPPFETKRKQVLLKDKTSSFIDPYFPPVP